MMITKRITSNKTPQGYSIHVWVKDGRLVKPLLAGIDKFFDAAEEEFDDSGQKRFF